MKHAKILIVAATFIFVAAMVSMLFVGETKAQGPTNAEDRADRKATRLERIKVRGQNIVERTTIRVDRVLQLNTKAGEIAGKMEQKGKDVSEARAFFETSSEKIASARAALNEATTILTQLETAENPLTVIQNFKAKIIEAYAALNAAKQNTLKGIKALKGASGASASAN
ncbi:MAG: hypothetical protein HY564_00855 [Candidatus Jacksonbacteria bacterium]|nr:hypothetical protein [Candidatus Jacksonbacteria bacterium]